MWLCLSLLSLCVLPGEGLRVCRDAWQVLARGVNLAKGQLLAGPAEQPMIPEQLGRILGPAQDEDARIRMARRDFLTAKNWDEAGRALQKLLVGIDPAKLPGLMNDRDTGIALHAAWELCLNPGQGKLLPRPQRFLGFLEGRTGLTPPLRWEVKVTSLFFLMRRSDHIRPTAAIEEYLPIAPFLHKERGWLLWTPQELARTELGEFAPVGTSLKRDGGDVLITQGTATLRLRQEILRRTDYCPPLLRCCAARLGPQRSFLVLYSDEARPFPLICVDSRSGRLLWQAQVWGSGWQPFSSGCTHHELSIEVCDNRVALFGETGSCYLEAFDLATGACAFRFCSGWWCHRK